MCFCFWGVVVFACVRPQVPPDLVEMHEKFMLRSDDNILMLTETEQVPAVFVVWVFPEGLNAAYM